MAVKCLEFPKLKVRHLEKRDLFLFVPYVTQIPYGPARAPILTLDANPQESSQRKIITALIVLSMASKQNLMNMGINDY